MVLSLLSEHSCHAVGRAGLICVSLIQFLFCATLRCFPDLRPLCCGTCISQDGSSDDDGMFGAAAFNEGSVVLVGDSMGTGAAVEIDPDGTAVWHWQVIQECPRAVVSECSVRLPGSYPANHLQ